MTRYDFEDFEAWHAEVYERPKSEAKFSGDKIKINVENLRVSGRIKNLIRGGWTRNNGFKSRSEADEAVIVGLLASGSTDDEIRGVFQSSPIGEKYREKRSAGDKYLAHSIARAKEHIKRNVQSAPKELEHLTDLGNARRLVALHGHDLRYCFQLGWLCWDGTRWVKDHVGEVERRAKQVIRFMYEEAARCEEETLRKAIAIHAKKSESEQRIKAMVSLAKSEPGIPATIDQLDRDRWAFNVLNGTLDLRSGRLREHRREDLITMLAPVEYDPEATCPTFDSFLGRIFSQNQHLISFVQRAIGYALTGDVSEQVLFFFHGPGSNGKSTLINAVLSTHGNYYAAIAAPGLLMMKRNENHPTELADLWGKRFIASVEVDQGKRFAEVLLKQVTGGDPLKGRFMRKDFFQFWPTHKIFIAGNHKPIIRGTDGAIWRRIHLVPFTVTIPDDEQDKKLPEKLESEKRGILAWAVTGCIAWQRDGLGTPEDVKLATAQYRAGMDTIGRFLEECCEINPEAESTVKELYQAYTQWCQESGEKPTTKNEFSQLMEERGFEPGRTGKKGRYWKGLKPTGGDTGDTG